MYEIIIPFRVDGDTWWPTKEQRENHYAQQVIEWCYETLDTNNFTYEDIIGTDTIHLISHTSTVPHETKYLKGWKFKFKNKPDAMLCKLTWG